MGRFDNTTNTENANDTPAVMETTNGPVSNTEAGDVSSSVKTGTQSTEDLAPTITTLGDNAAGSTPAAQTSSAGTTAVSAADASLGVTAPLDDITLTKPIDEPPVTQPMTTSEMLLQNPEQAMQVGMTGSLSPLQLQALATLGDLSKAHEGHTTVTGVGTEFQGPDGYYSVLQGWIMNRGMKLEAKQVGGRFYFDPADLDDDATKAMDKLVEAGSAFKQGGNANAN